MPRNNDLFSMDAGLPDFGFSDPFAQQSSSGSNSRGLGIGGIGIPGLGNLLGRSTKPDKPSKKEVEAAQQKAEQQSFEAEAAAVRDSLVTQPWWQQASIERKREALDNYEKNVWPAYAAQRFGADTIQSNRLKNRILVPLRSQLDKEAQEMDTWGNFFDSLGASFVTGVENLDASIDALHNYAMGKVGSEEAQQRAWERLQQTMAENDAARAARSAANPRIRNDEIRRSELIEEEGGAYGMLLRIAEQPSISLNLLTEQMPNLMAAAASFLLGGGVAALASRAAGTATTAAAQAAARAAAYRLGSRVGGMAGGGTLSLGGNASELINDILKMPIDELKKSPRYNELVARGMSEAEIRAAIANDAVNSMALQTFALGAGSALLGPEALLTRSSVLGPLFRGGGALRRFGTGAGLGILEEGTTEGGEQMLQNYGASEALGQPFEDRMWEGVGESVVIGGLVGGMTGGVGGLVSRQADGEAAPAGAVPDLGADVQAPEGTTAPTPGSGGINVPGRASELAEPTRDDATPQELTIEQILGSPTNVAQHNAAIQEIETLISGFEANTSTEPEALGYVLQRLVELFEQAQFVHPDLSTSYFTRLQNAANATGRAIDIQGAYNALYTRNEALRLRAEAEAERAAQGKRRGRKKKLPDLPPDAQIPVQDVVRRFYSDQNIQTEEETLAETERLADELAGTVTEQTEEMVATEEQPVEQPAAEEQPVEGQPAAEEQPAALIETEQLEDIPSDVVLDLAGVQGLPAMETRTPLPPAPETPTENTAIPLQTTETNLGPVPAPPATGPATGPAAPSGFHDFGWRADLVDPSIPIQEGDLLNTLTPEQAATFAQNSFVEPIPTEIPIIPGDNTVLVRETYEEERQQLQAPRPWPAIRETTDIRRNQPIRRIAEARDQADNPVEYRANGAPAIDLGEGVAANEVGAYADRNGLPPANSGLPISLRHAFNPEMRGQIWAWLRKRGENFWKDVVSTAGFSFDPYRAEKAIQAVLQNMEIAVTRCREVASNQSVAEAEQAFTELFSSVYHVPGLTYEKARTWLQRNNTTQLIASTRTIRFIKYMLDNTQLSEQEIAAGREAYAAQQERTNSLVAEYRQKLADWNARREARLETYFAEAEQYYAEHGRSAPVVPPFWPEMEAGEQPAQNRQLLNNFQRKDLSENPDEYVNGDPNRPNVAVPEGASLEDMHAYVEEDADINFTEDYPDLSAMRRGRKGGRIVELWTWLRKLGENFWENFPSASGRVIDPYRMERVMLDLYAEFRIAVETIQDRYNELIAQRTEAIRNRDDEARAQVEEDLKTFAQEFDELFTNKYNLEGLTYDKAREWFNRNRAARGNNTSDMARALATYLLRFTRISDAERAAGRTAYEADRAAVNNAVDVYQQNKTDWLARREERLNAYIQEAREGYERVERRIQAEDIATAPDPNAMPLPVLNDSFQQRPVREGDLVLWGKEHEFDMPDIMATVRRAFTSAIDAAFNTFSLQSLADLMQQGFFGQRLPLHLLYSQDTTTAQAPALNNAATQDQVQAYSTLVEQVDAAVNELPTTTESLNRNQRLQIFRDTVRPILSSAYTAFTSGVKPAAIRQVLSLINNQVTALNGLDIFTSFNRYLNDRLKNNESPADTSPVTDTTNNIPFTQAEMMLDAITENGIPSNVRSTRLFRGIVAGLVRALREGVDITQVQAALDRTNQLARQHKVRINVYNVFASRVAAAIQGEEVISGSRDNRPAETGEGSTQEGTSADSSAEAAAASNAGSPDTATAEGTTRDGTTAAGTGTGGTAHTDAGSTAGDVRTDQQDGTGTTGRTDDGRADTDASGTSTQQHLRQRITVDEIRKRAHDGRFASILGKLLNIRNRKRSAKDEAELHSQFVKDRISWYMSAENATPMTEAEARVQAEADWACVDALAQNITLYRSTRSSASTDERPGATLMQSIQRVLVEAGLTDLEINATTPFLARMLTNIGALMQTTGLDILNRLYMASTEVDTLTDAASRLLSNTERSIRESTLLVWDMNNPGTLPFINNLANLLRANEAPTRGASAAVIHSAFDLYQHLVSQMFVQSGGYINLSPEARAAVDDLLSLWRAAGRITRAQARKIRLGGLTFEDLPQANWDDMVVLWDNWVSNPNALPAESRLGRIFTFVKNACLSWFKMLGDVYYRLVNADFRDPMLQSSLAPIFERILGGYHSNPLVRYVLQNTTVNMPFDLMTETLETYLNRVTAYQRASSTSSELVTWEEAQALADADMEKILFSMSETVPEVTDQKLESLYRESMYGALSDNPAVLNPEVTAAIRNHRKLTNQQREQFIDMIHKLSVSMTQADPEGKHTAIAVYGDSTPADTVSLSSGNVDPDVAVDPDHDPYKDDPSDSVNVPPTEAEVQFDEANPVEEESTEEAEADLDAINETMEQDMGETPAGEEVTANDGTTVVVDAEPDPVDPALDAMAEQASERLQTVTMRESLAVGMREVEAIRNSFAASTFGPQGRANWWTRMVLTIRRSLKDGGAFFSGWCAAVFPSTSGHPDDNMLNKAFQGIASRIDGAANLIEDAVMTPINNWLQAHADRLGVDWQELGKEFGLYRTCKHTIEADVVRRRELVEAVDQARALPPGDARDAALAKAEGDLKAYTEWQAAETTFATPPIPVYGGRRVKECEALIARLEAKYGEELCTQGARLIGDGINWITHLNAQNGLISQQDVLSYRGWQWYCPMQTRVSNAENGATNDITHFAPRNNFHREGSMSPALDSYTTMVMYGKRSARSIGMQEWGNMLYQAYQILKTRDRARTSTSGPVNFYNGLALVSMAQVTAFREDASSPAHMRAWADSIVRDACSVIRIRTRVKRTNMELDGPVGDDQITSYYVVFRNPDEHLVSRGVGLDYTEISRAVRNPTYQTEHGKLYNAALTGTRALASTYTRMKALFPVINSVRDIIERLSMIPSYTYRAEDGRVVPGYRVVAGMMAFAANPANFVRVVRHYATGTSGNANFDAMMREFRYSGVEFSTSYSNLVKLANDDGQTLIRKYMPNAVRRLGRETIGRVTRVWGTWNSIFYALPSIAQFKTMRDQGVSIRDTTRGVTTLMDLRQRGKFTQNLSILYAFVPSIFQSAFNVTSTLGLNAYTFDKRFRKQNLGRAVKSWAIMLTCYAGVRMLIPMMASALGDGDDDKGQRLLDMIPLNQIANFIPIGVGGGSYVQMPVGFGYPMLANLIAHGADRVERGVMTPGSFAATLMTSVAKTLVPNSMPGFEFQRDPIAYLAQTFTPLTMQPLAQVATNRGFSGNTISYSNYNETERKSDRSRLTTDKFWKDAAQLLYRATSLDLSPEQLRTIVNGYCGGVLQGVMTWIESDPLYADASYKSTRQELGVFWTAVGATTIYNAGANVSQTLFYEAKEYYDNMIHRAGLGHILRGELPEKRSILEAAGFTQQEIDDYFVLYEASRELSLIDQDTRKKLDKLIGPDMEEAAVRAIFQDWSERRTNIQDGVFNSINFYQPGYVRRWSLSETTSAEELRGAAEGSPSSAATLSPYDVPVPRNPDGRPQIEIAFVQQGESGEYVVVPLMSPEGVHMDQNTAWNRFIETGQHFGMFRTEDSARAYLRQLMGI